MKTSKMKHFYIEFNRCITSYITSKDLKTAIKLAKKEFPEHFVVTNSGLVN